MQYLNKISKPIYKGFNNYEDAQKFMAENGVIVDELSSATELGLHENGHPNTPYDNGSEEDHSFTIQETPDCYESSERTNGIPEIQPKAILEESQVPSLSGIEKSNDSADAWFSESRKVLSRTNLVKSNVSECQ